jgi:hypothetical protein
MGVEWAEQVDQVDESVHMPLGWQGHLKSQLTMNTSIQSGVEKIKHTHWSSNKLGRQMMEGRLMYLWGIYTASATK